MLSHTRGPGETRTIRPSRAVRVRCAAIGLFLGCLVAFRGNVPLWEEAVRLLAVLLLVLPTARWFQGWRQRRQGADPGVRVSIMRVGAAKLLLIALLLLAEALLNGRIPGAHYAVGAAAGVLVAGAGPLVYPMLYVRARPAASSAKLDSGARSEAAQEDAKRGA